MGSVDELAMRARAEAYCEHVRGLKLRMESAQAAYEEARGAIDGIKGIAYDRIGGTFTAHGDDAVAAAVQRLDGCGEKMAESIAEWAREAEAFDALCAQLPPQSAYVLEMRYRNGAGWGEIADRMRYSPAYVRGSLRNRALAELYPIMPLCWK